MKTWVNPIVLIDHFTANEYIAACIDYDKLSQTKCFDEISHPHLNDSPMWTLRNSAGSFVADVVISNHTGDKKTTSNEPSEGILISHTSSSWTIPVYYWKDGSNYHFFAKTVDIYNNHS